MANQSHLLEQLQYEELILKDKDTNGKVVAIIGDTRDSDLDLNPWLIDSLSRAEDVFEGEELLSSFKEFSSGGGEFAYLIGLRYDSLLEKYNKLEEAYEIIDELNVDVILLTNCFLEESVYTYPKLPESFDIEFKIIAFETNNHIDTITFQATLDSSEKVNEVSTKNVIEYFDKEVFNDINDARFVVQNEYEDISIIINENGLSTIKAHFDISDYINKHIKKVFIVSQLAKYCRKTKSIGIIKGSDIERFNNKDQAYSHFKQIMKEVKESISNELRGYVGCLSSKVLTFGNEEYINPIVSYGSLFSLYGSNNSVSNKDIKNIYSIDNTFSQSEIKILTGMGYTFLFHSVRNGIVPFRSVSLADSNTISYGINVSRVINETLKRLQVLLDSFVGGVIFNRKNLNKEINELLKTIKNEGKLKSYKFNVIDQTDEYIEVKLEITVYGELSSLNVTAMSSLGADYNE